MASPVQQHPTVTTLLAGSRMETDRGSVAFCAVTLITGRDRTGALRRIVVDVGHTGRRRPLEAALAREGLTPGDIDTVLCTHAHWDHTGNLNVFRSSEIMLSEAERTYIRDPHPNDWPSPDWINGVFDGYRDRLTLVRPGGEVLPGVTLIDAAGHSAGSVAVAVETADGTIVVAGDAIQNTQVAASGRNALVLWDTELAERSIARIRDAADLVRPGHDLPFEMDAAGDFRYTEPFELTLTGLDGTEPGLAFSNPAAGSQLVMPGIETQRPRFPGLA
ncbi:MBL fold metallo-hydrolase [Gryllotalpicola reticulitermitis]|uniref:MBL fold metallo-hydrolase n=1 Tax=Gryllotalpicola reticulitermitis TaxID=1184153 RepID=A0ABV8Q2Q7_9MICO